MTATSAPRRPAPSTMPIVEIETIPIRVPLRRVYQGSHAWAVAAVFLAVTIPITALAPVAGLLLDRLPARPVLIGAAAVQAVGPR